MNITALNSTGYWKPFTDGSRGGSVEACIETYLKLVDPNGSNPDEEVKFVNNIVNISVSLGVDFSVTDAKVEREVQLRDYHSCMSRRKQFWRRTTQGMLPQVCPTISFLL